MIKYAHTFVQFGMPRTAYCGVVTWFKNETRFYAVPSDLLPHFCDDEVPKETATQNATLNEPKANRTTFITSYNLYERFKEKGEE